MTEEAEIQIRDTNIHDITKAHTALQVKHRAADLEVWSEGRGHHGGQSWQAKTEEAYPSPPFTWRELTTKWHKCMDGVNDL